MGKRKREQQQSPEVATPSSSEPNTNWNIDSYRTKYEPEEHWELRRTFMERHQHWIPEDELVCLAQVFVNVELLHCRYPLETMERLRELSKGVADEYRNSRKNKLQRTFVSASDAAASKVQRKGPGEQVKQQQQQKGPIQFVAGSSRKHKMVAPIRSLDDVYNNLVLMHNDYECTQQEFDKMGCGSKLELAISRGANGKTVGRISVGQFELASAEGDGEKSTRKAVKLAFMEAMNKHCYKIVRKKHAVHLANSNVERKAVQGAVDHRGRKVVNDFQEQKIDSSNLGFKLLQKLGWSGGSLGSKNEGIVDPINCQIKIGRQGLGGGAPAKKEQDGGGPPKKGKIDTRNETYGIDINFYRQMMRNFRDSGIEYDMVFSKDFTKEERALFHKGLTAIDPMTSETRWNIADEPAISVPSLSDMKPHYLLDPREGSLYTIRHSEGGFNKLPHTIPQLVASSPCRSSDGILYPGKKSDDRFLIDLKTSRREKVLGFGAPLDGDNTESIG